MKTIGEQRVRIDFNVSGNGDVDTIKRLSADLINFCEDRKESWDGNHGEINSEKNELYNLAQRAYEEAAMWAVKAATFQPEKEEKLSSFFEIVEKLYKSSLFTDGNMTHALLNELAFRLPFSDVKSINVVGPSYINELGERKFVESIKLTETTPLAENITICDVIVMYVNSPEKTEHYFVLRCSPDSIKKIN